MIFTTIPFLQDFEEISSIEEAKSTIKELCSMIRRKKLPKLDITITLSNGIHTTLVYYREDEKIKDFGKRLLKEAEKHL